MTSATLTKWGNSQGIIIPKSLCESLDIHIGDSLRITEKDGRLEVEPIPKPTNSFEHITATQLFSDWDGEYRPPEDWPIDPRINNEIDWGKRVGSEIW